MKIISIIGTRPQFIKCASMCKEIKFRHEHILINTGQHYDNNLSSIFLNELEIPSPDYNLDVGSGLHGEQTAKMLQGIEKILLYEKPDFILVYGDTNSTLSGSLAASKLQHKIGHIESGLRSFDKTMPEEINRIITDRISDFLFCPTRISVENLKAEGIEKNVYLVGDLMFDSLLYYKKIAETKSSIINDLNLVKGEYIVVTIHRESNTNSETNLTNIVEALCEINEDIIFPIHPRTLKYLKKYSLYDQLSNHVTFVEPLGYFDFIKLINNSKKLITDSGGAQKEAYMLDVPCITLRCNTEWIETVNDGWNILVGPYKEKIINAVFEFSPTSRKKNVFGDGDSSKKILNTIEDVILGSPQH